MFSSESEIFLVTGISNLSLLVYNTFPYKNVFLDFLFWILPQYFIIMHPEEKKYLIGFLICLLYGTNNIICKSNNKSTVINHSIIGILRSYIALQVAICILGVDFQGIFPLKFGKSIDYGYKLMDIGVGSYLYNSGLMIKKTNILVLFMLGFIRYFTILIFNLQVEVTEYGRHSNFYFILGLLQLLYKLVPFNKMGYFLLILYHITTRYYGIDSIILNTNRNGIIMANKETLFVLIPFLSLLMIVQDVSRVLFNTTGVKYKLVHLSKHTFVFYAFYRFSLLFELPSRRLGNNTFIFQILYLHTAHLLFYTLVSVFTGFQRYPTLHFVSRNMMGNFLLTNILVLVFKQLISFRNEYCHLVMILYLIISFSIPPLLYKDKRVNQVRS